MAVSENCLGELTTPNSDFSEGRNLSRIYKINPNIRPRSCGVAYLSKVVGQLVWRHWMHLALAEGGLLIILLSFADSVDE
jgi:hypothetical protein